MKSTLRRLLRDGGGQDLPEYGLALAVVALTAASAAMLIANDTKLLWARAMQKLIVVVMSI